MTNSHFLCNCHPPGDADYSLTSNTVLATSTTACQGTGKANDVVKTKGCLENAYGAVGVTAWKVKSKDALISEQGTYTPAAGEDGVGDCDCAGAGASSEACFHQSHQKILSSASGGRANMAESNCNDIVLSKPEEPQKSKAIVIKHELGVLEIDTSTVRTHAMHSNTPVLHEYEHAQARGQGHPVKELSNAEAEAKTQVVERNGLVIEKTCPAEMKVQRPMVEMDKSTRASNKRWRSRVTLISKALAAWSPSPDMPTSAVSSSIYAGTNASNSNQLEATDDDESRTAGANMNINAASLSTPQKIIELKSEACLPTNTATATTTTPAVSNVPTKEQQQNTQPSLPDPAQASLQLQLHQDDVSLDADQQAAVDAALNGESFFLTGSAGTGKSFVLKQIITALRNTGLSVVVTASTGCAAVAIQGCTIHSASGVGLGMDSLNKLRHIARHSKPVRNRLLKPDVLIIDEVSMLDSVLFEKIEAMYTEARKHVGLAITRGSVTDINRMRTEMRERLQKQREEKYQAKRLYRQRMREIRLFKRQRLSNYSTSQGGSGGVSVREEKNEEPDQLVGTNYEQAMPDGDQQHVSGTSSQQKQSDFHDMNGMQDISSQPRNDRYYKEKYLKEKLNRIERDCADTLDVNNDSADPPFGGIQVIACGDFFQLPPVAASDPALQFSKQKYFAFACDAWKRALGKTVVLRQVHRQSDRHFVGLLNELRYGIVTHRTMRVLSACRVAGYEAEAYDDGTPVHYTKLYAYRAQVDNENTKRLEELPGRAIAYRAKDFVDRPKLGGLHISAVEQLLKNTTAVERTVLKTGARVLCVKNVDQLAGIVNGTAGTVVGFTLPTAELAKRRLAMRTNLTKMEYREKLISPFTVDGLIKEEVVDADHEVLREYLHKECVPGRPDGVPEVDVQYGQMLPVVTFDNGVTRTMGSETWSVFGLSGQEVANRKQIPLILGWALTIHKAQGMTLDLVETDVGKAFDYGQVYVAVSRARQMQGLRLTTFNMNKVLAHEEVRAFYDETLVSTKTECAKKQGQIRGSGI